MQHRRARDTLQGDVNRLDPPLFEQRNRLPISVGADRCVTVEAWQCPNDACWLVHIRDAMLSYFFSTGLILTFTSGTIVIAFRSFFVSFASSRSAARPAAVTAYFGTSMK